MQGKKRILLVYDPTPHLKSSVDLAELGKEAPPELQAAFAAPLKRSWDSSGPAQADAVVLPFPAGGVSSKQLAFAKVIMAEGGLATREDG